MNRSLLESRVLYSPTLHFCEDGVIEEADVEAGELRHESQFSNECMGK